MRRRVPGGPIEIRGEQQTRGVFGLADLRQADDRSLVENLSRRQEGARDRRHRQRRQDLQAERLPGKVVVLDFFADWCPYCVKMYPEDARSVKAGRQAFALSASTATARTRCADPRGPEGRLDLLVRRQGLDRSPRPGRSRGYPIMYVIDQEGVIRHKFSGQTSHGPPRSDLFPS